MRHLAIALSLVVAVSVSLPGRASAASVAQQWGTFGTEPFGLTVDPRDGLLYVANSEHGRTDIPGVMAVVDPSLPPSPTFNGLRFASPPTMSVLDPELGRLFVTTNDRSLVIVDAATKTTITTLPGVGTLGIALDPTLHRVYSSSLSGLWAVDAASGMVLAHAVAPAADSWWSVALDPARHRVYVTNVSFDAPSLVVLDDRDLNILAHVALPEVPRLALAVDVVRGLVYVGGYNTATFSIGGHLYAVDESSLQIVRTLDVGRGLSTSIWATLDSATDRLYLSNTGPSQNEGELVVVDAAAFTVSQRFHLPWQPGMNAVHPDGRLYVTSLSGGFVAAVLLQNSAPVIDSWTVAPTEAKTNDVLTTSVVAHDPDGDPITVSYQWYVNTTNVAGQQQPIPGETSPTLDLSKPGNGDREDLICLAIAVSDGQLTTDNFNCWLFIQDSAPTAVVSLAPNAPTTNALVTAIATGTDADGDAISYAFTWKVNGVVRRVTSATSGSDTLDLSLAGNGDRGDAVTVEVVASDDLLSGPRATASVTVADSAPTLTVSLNEATPSKRDVLVATAVAADADHDALTYTYVWRVNGKLKQTTTGTSATTSAFDLRAAQAEIGDRVTIDVTVSDGTAAAAASASATVTPAGH